MKLSYFINTKKKTICIVPSFLKKIYIKKNFYPLPNNIFLRKIITFIYLKIFRKSSIIMTLLLKTKIKWKNPRKFQFIIFDDNSVGTVDKVLPSSKYFILTNRIQNISEIYISKKIIFYLLKNLFKQKIKINYLCCIIKLVKPNKIITIIDNSEEFHIIYKIFKNSDIQFYALQNAVRHQDAYKRIFSMANYSANYFCFGNYELNSIKKNSLHNKTLNIKAIGSLRVELAKEFLSKKNKNRIKHIYDICLISEASSEIGSSGSLKLAHWKNNQRVAAKILRYTLRFCKEHNKKLLFLGRRNIDEKLGQEEEDLYYKYKNDVGKFKISFFDKYRHENIKNLLQSKVVVAQTSTLLREAFGLKKKILVCEWGAKKYREKDYNTNAFSEKGIVKLKSSTYQDFEKRLFKILKIDSKQYFMDAHDAKSIYNLDFNTLKFLRNEMRK